MMSKYELYCQMDRWYRRQARKALPLYYLKRIKYRLFKK